MIGEWWNILARLGCYFRVAGVLSVIAWLAVVALLAVFAVRAGRAYFRCAAVVLCGVGLLLGYMLAGPLGLGGWGAMVVG
ncbi:hypothetical protein LCGC14_3072820, partial [marine sediment metagenome]